MKTLLFATNNKHKLEEIRSIAGSKTRIISLSEIGFNEDIPETSETIAGNALQKAQYLFERTGLAVFADDTGLEVEALGGAPGVYSARYAGPQATYEENVEKLLKALENENNRNARFVTVIALVTPNDCLLFEGVVNGQITREKLGEKGFGYDPVFLPDGHQLTYAQMSPEQKNSMSHRALATQKLISYLGTLP
ncbi:MAG TPA: RdgB/HAM1 family non-canonical purine NTP pyrophosphatase [Bacteroidales bacterium]|nr:RdgB/HAM1 family non-canonical purine NTP pyrophosphatase [Bacteroidales bacterium]